MRQALDAHVPEHRPSVAEVEQRLGAVSALAKGIDAPFGRRAAGAAAAVVSPAVARIFGGGRKDLGNGRPEARELLFNR